MTVALGAAPGRALIAIVRLYQIARSNHPSPCRYVPSCSQYAIDAISSRGAVIGTGFALARVLRCNPLGGRGFDPAPVRR